ncbi:hypothetical protein CMO83_02910 [Candidatus Woesearchaeota archaeon]|nr:hypothetical protein [Candidatus Woesearchaeota archaeon]
MFEFILLFLMLIFFIVLGFIFQPVRAILIFLLNLIFQSGFATLSQYLVLGFVLSAIGLSLAYTFIDLT